MCYTEYVYEVFGVNFIGSTTLNKTKLITNFCHSTDFFFRKIAFFYVGIYPTLISCLLYHNLQPRTYLTAKISFLTA